jgi:hypothetical protein
MSPILGKRLKRQRAPPPSEQGPLRLCAGLETAARPSGVVMSWAARGSSRLRYLAQFVICGQCQVGRTVGKPNFGSSAGSPNETMWLMPPLVTVSTTTPYPR